MNCQERFDRCSDCKNCGSAYTNDLPRLKIQTCNLLKGKWTAEIINCPINKPITINKEKNLLF